MVLGQVSWLDCLVFLIFLIPQLILNVGFFPTLFCGLAALPFLLIRLPLAFFHDHFLLRKFQQSPFLQRASWFEDVVIRLIRYAFTYIPADIGRVFFSKHVALPFLRFRMLRHGYLRYPIHWKGIEKNGFRGLWMIDDKNQQPDVVVLYVHGGGFSMGSSYFYLEFLLAFLSLLKARTHFNNPAILSVEYTLVPDASYPTQTNQVQAAYFHAVSIMKEASKVIVGGDSAGGTLVLSLLLHLSRDVKSKTPKLDNREKNGQILDTRPGLAILISPWTTLISPLDHLTTSDYLNPTRLHHYARQYSGLFASTSDPLLSPGNCSDTSWWQRAAPKEGFFITYGAEEVFAPEIRKFVSLLGEVGVRVEGKEDMGGIHAWVVAALFLSSSREKRTKGLEEIMKCIGERMGTDETLGGSQERAKNREWDIRSLDSDSEFSEGD